MKRIIVASTALALSCAAGPIQAGIVLTIESTSQNEQGQVTKTTDTQYIDGSKSKSTSADGAQIFDLDKGVMIMVSDAQKTYSEIPLKGSFMAMGAAMASQMKYKAKGTHKTVAGYSCDEYDIDMGMPNIQQTACFSTAALGAKESEALSRKMIAAMGAQPPATQPPGAQLSMTTTTQPPNYAEMFKNNPAMAKQMQANAKNQKPTVHTSTVLSIKSEAIPASTFAVPAGYKKADNPFGMPSSK